MFFQPTTGTTWVMKVGNTDQEPKALAENIINAINAAVKSAVSGHWKNIRALHIKTETSISLPIYAAVPDVGLKIENSSVPVVPKTRVDPAERWGFFLLFSLAHLSVVCLSNIAIIFSFFTEMKMLRTLSCALWPRRPKSTFRIRLILMWMMIRMWYVLVRIFAGFVSFTS